MQGSGYRAPGGNEFTTGIGPKGSASAVERSLRPGCENLGGVLLQHPATDVGIDLASTLAK
jgi:hypothetical protein